MYLFFFFNDTATTEIYTLSLHDALPICARACGSAANASLPSAAAKSSIPTPARSEEHTSELQSQSNLVCRLLLEKKKQDTKLQTYRDPAANTRAESARCTESLT